MPTPQTSGVENASVLDLVAHDPITDEVVLVLSELRPWLPTPERFFQVQEKVNSYLSFARDGEMAESYPDFVTKPLRLQLECGEYPDPQTVDFLDKLRADLLTQKVNFVVRVREKMTLPPPPTSTGCGCGAV